MNDDRDLDTVERRYGADKKIRVYAVRRSRGQIERQMTPKMFDAEREIESAFRSSAGHMGYATMRPDYIRGGEPDPERLQDIIKHYRAWSKICPRLERAIVLDYILGSTTSQIEEQRGMDPRIIVGYFLRGLDEYCKMRKW